MCQNKKARVHKASPIELLIARYASPKPLTDQLGYWIGMCLSFKPNIRPTCSPTRNLWFVNKSAQSNLGRGPRRSGVAHEAELWPACLAETRWASVAWLSFMNMAKLKWLSWADRRIWSDDPSTPVNGWCNLVVLGWSVTDFADIIEVLSCNWHACKY